MVKYILRHKINGAFLKKYKALNYHHYVRNILDATKFDKQQANIQLKKFKHPENWEIVNRATHKHE
jgi:hypothetical protein